MKNLIRNKKGFTIIEVMIVLAVAGVIMLIVLLAVPALERSQRNTQRKNDVTTIVGGVNDYASNNNGALPTAWANNQFTGAAGTTPSGAKLGYYTAVPFATGTQGALSTDTVQLVTGATCSTTVTGGTTAGGARAFAVQYENEGSSGLVAACQD